MRNFGIIVGRWYGVWSWLWYADLMTEHDDVPYASFNSLTRHGAIKKAKRYIRKNISPVEDIKATAHIYDLDFFSVEEIKI